MNIWLPPINVVPRYSIPPVTVIVSIQEVCCKAGIVSPKLEYFIGKIAALSSSSLWKVYDFKNELLDALNDISNIVREPVEWSLLFQDYDIHFAAHTEFLKKLTDFPYLKCHLLVADDKNPVTNIWRGVNGVFILEEGKFCSNWKSIGFPPSISADIAFRDGIGKPKKAKQWRTIDD